MLRDIIRKEIMDNVSTLKFVVTFGVVIVLVISGLMLGSRNYIDQRGEVNRQRQLNEKMLESQRDWLSAGWTGVIESKKPHVLTTVDAGIDNSLGRLGYVNTLMDARLDESRNLVSPILAVFGDVDLTFIVKIILSLFVILLTYDAVSGEKERGTLKLSLANEVPRYKLLLGKIFGGFSVIAFSFILPLLIGLAFMMAFYSNVLADFTPDAWWRLLIIVGIYLLYLAVFFSLGLLVSASCQRSSTSFIILLVMWVLFVTIIPRVSLSTAERLKPYESYTTLQTKAYKEIAEQRQKMMKDMMPKFITAQQRMAVAEFTGQNTEPSTEFSELQTQMWEGMTSIQEEVMGKYDLQYERQQNEQIALAESMSRFFSPASSMSFAVENLAGSGWSRQYEYVKQMREFRNTFVDYIYETSRKIEYTGLFSMFESQKLDIDPNKIKFEFLEESLPEVVERSILDIGVLALMAIIFFAASFVVFLRYDVR